MVYPRKSNVSSGNRHSRVYDAPLRVFIGDGLGWNWSIWKKYFPTFTPVLDFIHAIQYVYCAACR